MIRLVNPAREEGAVVGRKPLPRLPDLTKRSIGMLSNGTSDNFFHGLADLLKHKYPQTQILFWRKPHINKSPPPDMWAEVMEKSDGVVCGVCA
ncbi:hypothetical protein ACFLXT_01840 [Chloroflexota bacterium]